MKFQRGDKVRFIPDDKENLALLATPGSRAWFHNSRTKFYTVHKDSTLEVAYVSSFGLITFTAFDSPAFAQDRFYKVESNVQLELFECLSSQ